MADRVNTTCPCCSTKLTVDVGQAPFTGKTVTIEFFGQVKIVTDGTEGPPAGLMNLAFEFRAVGEAAIASHVFYVTLAPVPSSSNRTFEGPVTLFAEAPVSTKFSAGSNTLEIKCKISDPTAATTAEISQRRLLVRNETR